MSLPVELQTVPCKGCGKPIVWATDDKGVRHPLDPRAPVYIVARDLDGTVSANRVMGGMVTHFATCSKANEFSKGKKP